MLFRKKPRPPVLDPADAERRLIEFVKERSPLARQLAISPETRLFSSGILDSLGFVDLVAFIDRELGVALGERVHVDMDVLDRLGDVVLLMGNRPG